MDILKLAQEFERLASWDIKEIKSIEDRPSKDGKHSVETHLMKQYGFTRFQATVLLKSLFDPRKLRRFEDKGGYQLVGFGELKTPSGKIVSLDLLKSTVTAHSNEVTSSSVQPNE